MSLTDIEVGEIGYDATKMNGQHRLEEGKVRSCREKDAGDKICFA